MAFLWDPFGAYIPRPSPRNKMRFRFLKSYRYLFYGVTDSGTGWNSGSVLNYYIGLYENIL